MRHVLPEIQCQRLTGPAYLRDSTSSAASFAGRSRIIIFLRAIVETILVVYDQTNLWVYNNRLHVSAHHLQLIVLTNKQRHVQVRSMTS